MVYDRGIRGAETSVPQECPLASAATEAYNAKDTNAYCHIFTNKSTPDSTKSDAQLNTEINNHPSIYGQDDSSGGGIRDLQKGIHSDGRTQHDLAKAIGEAGNGDITGAMKDLRKATGDLNDAGGKIDSGLGSLNDAQNGDSVAKSMIQKGLNNEGDASSNIEKAESLLRQGDTNGAIDAMEKGTKEVAHEQKLTKAGVERFKQDDEFGSNSSTDSSPQSQCNAEYTRTSSDTYAQMRNADNGNQNFDPEQQFQNTNGVGTPTQSFAPDNSNQSYGQFGPLDLQNGASNSGSGGGGGLPNPFDMLSGMGLPTPPNPSDLLNSLPNPLDMLSGGNSGSGGGLPNPFDMFGGGSSGSSSGSGLPNPFEMIGGGSSGSGGGLPNPFDMFGGGSSSGGGGLPNPFDMFGGGSSSSGGGLPNPFDMIGGDNSGSSSGSGLPNPFDMFGGGSSSGGGLPNPLTGLESFATDPLKPVENLLTPPDLSKPKDVIKKILDPIGLFG